MLYWTADPLVATYPKDRPQKLKPRAKPYSPAYIQQQLWFLRVFSGWIGKAGMVMSAAHYVTDVALVERTSAAQYDHSWSARMPSPEELIAKVATANAWVGVQLQLMLAFGLRRKEAIMFRPHLADLPASAMPVPYQGNGNYLVFVRVKRGTKGGRLRFTAVRNDDQRRALQLACQFAKSESSHLGQPGLSLEQSIKLFANTMAKCGITKAALGVTAHGLRHQFAGELYYDLTTLPPPIRAATDLSDQIDMVGMREAYLEVARQLGHGRHRVSTAYLAALPRKKPDAD